MPEPALPEKPSLDTIIQEINTHYQDTEKLLLTAGHEKGAALPDLSRSKELFPEVVRFLEELKKRKDEIRSMMLSREDAALLESYLDSRIKAMEGYRDLLQDTELKRVGFLRGQGMVAGMFQDARNNWNQVYGPAEALLDPMHHGEEGNSLAKAMQSILYKPLPTYREYLVRQFSPLIADTIINHPLSSQEKIKEHDALV